MEKDRRLIYIAGYKPDGRLTKTLIGRDVFELRYNSFVLLGTVGSTTQKGHNFRIKMQGRRGFYSINSLSDGSGIYNDQE